VDGRKGTGVEDGETGRARSQLPVYSIISEAASRLGEALLFVLLVLCRNRHPTENLVLVE
jgi:hypothetical protein